MDLNKSIVNKIFDQYYFSDKYILEGKAMLDFAMNCQQL
jgi:hypothetical protein